jgi:tetratricopeptide (TPR) repeat protein
VIPNFVGILALSAIALTASCAPRKTVVESQIETIREEQSPDKLIHRGRAFAVVGDYTRAEQYFAAAIDAGADVEEALPSLLRACLAERRFRAAIAYAQPQLDKEPENFRLRFVIGSLYATIGDNTMAWEHLKQVAKERPGYPEVHFALGMLALAGEDDPVVADEHFRDYLRLRPAGSHAKEARGHLLTSMP